MKAKTRAVKAKTRAGKSKVNYGIRQAVYFALQDKPVLVWAQAYARQRKVGFSRIVVECLLSMKAGLDPRTVNQPQGAGEQSNLGPTAIPPR